MGVSSVTVLVLCAVTIISDSSCQNNGNSSNLENKFCPPLTICGKPMQYYRGYRCARDNGCFEGYKCCRTTCYMHKVCVIPVDKEGKTIVPESRSSTSKTITTTTQRSSTQFQESTTTVLPARRDPTLGYFATSSKIVGSGNGENGDDEDYGGTADDFEATKSTSKVSTTAAQQISSRFQESTTTVYPTRQDTTLGYLSTSSEIVGSGNGENGDDEDYGGTADDFEATKSTSKVSTTAAQQISTRFQESTTTVHSTRQDTTLGYLSTSSEIVGSGNGENGDDEDYGGTADDFEAAKSISKVVTTTTRRISTRLQESTMTVHPTRQDTTLDYLSTSSEIVGSGNGENSDDEDYSGTADDFEATKSTSKVVTTTTRRISTRLQELTTTVHPTRQDTTLSYLSTSSEIVGSGNGENDDGENYDGSSGDSEATKPTQPVLSLTTIIFPKPRTTTRENQETTTIIVKNESPKPSIITSTAAASTHLTTARYSSTIVLVDGSGNGDDEDYTGDDDDFETTESLTTIQLPKLRTTRIKEPSTVLQEKTTTSATSESLPFGTRTRTASSTKSQEVTAEYTSTTITSVASGDHYYDNYETPTFTTTRKESSTQVQEESTTSVTNKNTAEEVAKEYTPRVPIVDGSGDDNDVKEGDDKDYSDDKNGIETQKSPSTKFNTTQFPSTTMLEQREENTKIHASTGANESPSTSIAADASELSTVVATAIGQTTLGYSSTPLSTNIPNDHEDDESEDDKEVDSSGDDDFEIDQPVTSFSGIITTIKQESSTKLEENVTASYTTSGTTASALSTAIHTQVEDTGVSHSSTESLVGGSTSRGDDKSNGSEDDIEMKKTVSTLVLLDNISSVTFIPDSTKISYNSSVGGKPAGSHDESSPQANTILPTMTETSSSRDFQSTINQHTVTFGLENSSDIPAGQLHTIPATVAANISYVEQLPDSESAALVSSKQVLDSLTEEGSGYDEDEDDDDNPEPEEE